MHSESGKEEERWEHGGESRDVACRDYDWQRRRAG